MKFLSLLAALLLEQVRPLREGNPAETGFDRYADQLERQLNAGAHRHGVIAWCLAVLPLVIATAVISHALYVLTPFASLVWSVAVLYVTMGVRRFSHYFTVITRALREQDVALARETLSRWRGKTAAEFTPNEIARVSIELGLLGSHRHVFGPIALFIVLGPAGALLYRLSAMLAARWGERREPEFGDFGNFAERAFFWIDWLPARLTAASFAVVGNFEDAIFCWRTQAAAWAASAHGIILASGGGALGVRLGDPLRGASDVEFRPELGSGDPADVDYMSSTVGLIWRALVLWVFLIFIVTIAHSLG